MCGRYSITTPPQQLAERFQAKLTTTFEPRFNAAPTQALPVVVLQDERTISLFRWGLIPHWAENASIGNKMINARAETLAQKPSYREPFQKRRCLVPADGFYEWQQCDGSKVPNRMILANQEPFAFAGLWDSWRDHQGEMLYSFTIITTAPNELVAPVHNRMPVILPRAGEDVWLNPKTHPADLHELLQPYPSEQMQVYTVSTLVNSPSNNDPEVLKPLEVGGGGSDVGSW